MYFYAIPKAKSSKSTHLPAKVRIADINHRARHWCLIESSLYKCEAKSIAINHVQWHNSCYASRTKNIILSVILWMNQSAKTKKENGRIAARIQARANIFYAKSKREMWESDTPTNGASALVGIQYLQLQLAVASSTRQIKRFSFYLTLKLASDLESFSSARTRSILLVRWFILLLAIFIVWKLLESWLEQNKRLVNNWRSSCLRKRMNEWNSPVQNISMNKRGEIS